jgi:lipoate-protein ligase A
LESSIKTREEKYTDKAVKSNRSRVTNIQSHSPKNLDLKTFKAEIIHHLIHQFPGSKIRDFSSDELNEIQKLANEKYNSWEWNFGYSPRYAFNGIIRGKESEEKIRIQVKNGLIESLETDSYDFSKTTFYQTVFYHIPHQPEAIQMLYSQNESDFLKFGITKENLLSAFF